MMKKLRTILIAAALALTVNALPRPAAAQSENIDALLKQLQNVGVATPTLVLTLDECIGVALDSNPKLAEKLTALNVVAADELIDKSRFFSHVDVLASFTKQDGSLLKSYYPTYNPQPVSSAGMASIGTEQLSNLSSGAGISTADIESLTGMNSSDIASLAASYGVDISKFGFRPTGNSAAAALSPAERVAAQRAADLTVSTPFGNVIIPDDQLESLIASTIGTSDSSSQNKYTDNRLSVRYSRRILEWGKDPISKVGIRSNRRLAVFNYTQEMRNVLSELRKTFYIVLLKQTQIQERNGLLEAYEKKLREQQLRYEVAKDVPMIDVLTAELDVLNEKLRINTLKNELVNKKMELLQLMGKPVGMGFEVSGNPPDLKNFEFNLGQVVDLTKENSYQVTYLNEEIKESERELIDIKRNYRPKYTGKAGFESRRSTLGFTINNYDNTYGLDMGAEQHYNLPRDGGSTASSLLGGSHTKDDNYYMQFAVTWTADDNMKKEGITRKQLEDINKMKAQLKSQELAEELQAREAWQTMQEAIEQLSLQEDTVRISDRRLEITRKLREFGKVAEYQLDSYRTQYFNDQDRLFSAQENVITAQENLRKIMGVFE